MFETNKTLIVVYKDELLVNQLKKMVETHYNDEQGVVDTGDDPINIISWTEKIWLGHKKEGNIKGKILFLGDIKGNDKLIPVIDVKFDKYGVKFGWAGNQAVIYADPKVLTTRKDYDAFLEKLSLLPVPSSLKATKESVGTTGTNHNTKFIVEQPTIDVPESVEKDTAEACEKKHKSTDILKGVKKVVSTGTDSIEKFGTQIVSKSEEIFRNKPFMKQQMLIYGVVSFYNNGLEKFINM